MVLATFVLLSLCFSMEVEESTEPKKVDQLSEIAKKKFIESSGMPSDALEVDPNNQIDIGKYLKFAKNKFEYYTLIYSKNDRIASKQAYFHREIVEKLKGKSYFPYTLFELTSGPYIHNSFRLNNSPAINLVEFLKTRPLGDAVNALLQMIQITKELESFGVSFTKLNSDSFFITQDKVIIFNPIDFATGFKAGESCYLQTQHLLIRESSAKAIVPTKQDNVGLTFGLSTATKEWNVFSFISAIVDYSVYNIKNHYSDEEREKWFDIYYSFANLQEQSILKSEISYDWNSLEKIINRSPNKETASSGAEAASSSTKKRNPRATTTDQSPTRSRKGSDGSSESPKFPKPPKSPKSPDKLKTKSRSPSPGPNDKKTVRKHKR